MAYMPISNWIALDRKISPTAATTLLHDTLVTQGADIRNLGQGREITELPGLEAVIRREFEEAKKLVNSQYNGMDALMFEAVASWMQQILGVDTTKQTSFALQSLGRDPLDKSFHLMAKLANFRRGGKFLIPDSSWPMVGDLLGDYNLSSAPYAMEPGKYAANIAAQIERSGGEIIGVYINSPHNPTGQILTSQDFKEIFGVLDHFNSGEPLRRRGDRKIGIILDNPYPHANPQVPRGEGTGLDAGLEVFTQDSITPWIMPVSASKFFGTASPGFTMIAAHPYYAAHLKSRFIRTTGLSFFKPFFNAMMWAISEDQFGSNLAHFAEHANKYFTNRTILETAMPGKVVPGNPGMTALVEIDPKEFMERMMTRHDGSDFPIMHPNDVVEYLLNKHGVAVVFNGYNEETGFARFRLAAALQPDNYGEGVDRFRSGMSEIAETPLHPSLEQQLPVVAGQPTGVSSGPG